MKDYLEYEGFNQVKSCKQAIRTAFQFELIDDAEKWMSVVEKRNLASHTYNQIILEETVASLQTNFSPL